MARWWLALTLSLRIGRDPKECVEFVTTKWGRHFRRDLVAVEDRVDRGEASLADVAKVARLVAAEHKSLHVILTIHCADDGELSFGCTRIKGMSSFGNWLAEDGAEGGADDVCVVLNLTTQLQRLDAALLAAYAAARDDDEEEPARERA